MSHVCETRTTHRPVDEVFAYVADFSTTAEYDPGVAEATRCDDGELAVGSRFDVVAVFLGRQLPMHYTITALDPPHRVELRGRSSTSTAHDVIRFEPTDGGTRITWALDLKLRGLSRLGSPFMGPLLRRLGRKALDGLADRLADPRPLR